MRALLDVNVLIALLDAGHIHHQRARQWLEQEIEIVKLGSDPNCFEMTVWRRQAAKITRRGENSRWLPPVFVEDGLRRAMGTEGR